MILSFSDLKYTIINNPEYIEKKPSRVHIKLCDVLCYLKTSVYPDNVRTQGAKSNFRKQCRTFEIVNGLLFYKKTNARVILNEAEKLEIIKLIHCGRDTSVQSSLLSGHRGRDKTQRLLKQRYINI